MAKYYITYTEHTYEITPPSDEFVAGEEYSDYGESGVEVYLQNIYRYHPGTYHQIVESGSYDDYYGLIYDIPDGNMAYVIVVNYQDGDTFGRSGYWCIPAITYDKDVANNIKDGIERGIYSVIRGTPPWETYFACLNSIEIIPMVVVP